jgi:hypothetical protein
MTTTPATPATPTAPIPAAVPALYFDALYFEPGILKTDQDLSRRFASPDATFEDIVAAADESLEKLLLALAASPLKRREEGLRSWREKQVAKLLADNRKAGDFRQYGESLESAQWEKIKSGECALIDIEHGAFRFFEDINRESSRLYKESKKALNMALQKAVHDPGDNTLPFELPQSLYVSEDGEVLLFRRAKNARKYGIERGKFHVVVHLAQGTARFRRGSGT